MKSVIQGKSPAKYCTGCMQCIDTCSKEAITIHRMKDGHYFPVIDNAKCVDCGRCAQLCPVNKTLLSEVSQNLINDTYCAWNYDGITRQNSSSGGYFMP